MDNSEILKYLDRFCSTDDWRPSLREPFRHGQYMYATDGRVCVRYRIPDGCSDFPDEVEGHPSVENVFKFDSSECGVKFRAGDIEALKFLYREIWVKHVQQGIVSNPDHMNEFYCPCCRTRLYESGRELVDADEYDSNADRLHGYDLKLPDGSKVFLKGSCLSDLMDCQALGFISEAIVYKPANGTDARLYAKGGQWEFLCMLYGNGHDAPWKALDEIRVGCPAGEGADGNH